MATAGSVEALAERARGERFRIRLVFRGVPRAVWLITALFISVMLVWTVLTPGYRAPDELTHIDNVLRVERDGSYPAPGDARMLPESIGAAEQAGLTMPLPLGRAAAPDRLLDLSEVEPDFRPHPNQMTQHPPLFYALLAAFLSVLPGVDGMSTPAVMLLLRLVNVLMMAPLPLLAFVLARRTCRLPSVPVAAALVPVGIPQITFIGGTVNNDNLIVPIFALASVGVGYVVTGDRSRGTGLRLGLLMAVGMLTKGFGLLLLPLVGSAYLSALWQARKEAAQVRLVTGAGLLSLVVGLVGGGWWWLRNVLVFGAVQPAGFQPYPTVPGFQPDFPFWFSVFVKGILQRFWGGFGRLEAPLPMAGVTLGVILLGVGIVVATLPGGPLRPRVWATALLPVTLLLVLVGTGAYSHYATFDKAAGIQGRYLFPGVVGLAVCAAAGWGLILRRVSTWQPFLFLVGFGGLQVLGIWTAIVKFWGGGQIGPFRALSAAGAWSPLVTPVLYASLALAVAVAVAVVVELLPVQVRRPGLLPQALRRSSRPHPPRRRA